MIFALILLLQRTGEVKSTLKLDREQMSSYNCIVNVTDSGQPQKSAQKAVQVRVNDENDNVPVSNQTKYAFDITEEQSSSLQLGSIVAADKDDGDNGRLTYTIRAGSSILDKFKVNTSTGEVSAKTKLDREAQPSYSFDVRVSDKGQPVLYVDVKIVVSVKDINDNNPIFDWNTYVGSIRENSAAGSKVIQVTMIFAWIFFKCIPVHQYVRKI